MLKTALILTKFILLLKLQSTRVDWNENIFQIICMVSGISNGCCSFPLWWAGHQWKRHSIITGNGGGWYDWGVSAADWWGISILCIFSLNCVPLWNMSEFQRQYWYVCICVETSVNMIWWKQKKGTSNNLGWQFKKVGSKHIPVKKFVNVV